MVVARGWFVCPRCGVENQANWVIQDKDGCLRLGGCDECWNKQSDREWYAVVNEIRLAAERYEAMIADLAKFMVQYYGNFVKLYPRETNPLNIARMIMQDRWRKDDVYDHNQEKQNDI